MASPTCPTCNHVLAASEMRDGWCDECGKKLPSHLATQPTSPMRSPSVAYSSPSSSSPSSSLARAPVNRYDILGWGTVRAGLAQVVLGGILFGVSMVAQLWLRSASLNFSPRSGTTFLVLTQLVSMLLGFGFVLLAAGLCMGCAAPEAGARGWAIGQAVCIVILLILVFLVLISEVSRESDLNPRISDLNPRIIVIALQVLLMVLAVFSLLFLRGVASYLGNASLAKSILIFMAIALPLMAAEVLLGSVLALQSSLEQVKNVEALMGIMMAPGAVFCVCYFVLAGLVRSTITRAMLR